MKKIIYVFISQLIALFSTYGNSLQIEKRTVVFSASESGRVQLLLPGSSITQNVTFKKSDYPVRRYIRVVGGVKMPAPFSERGEDRFRDFEFYIDDNLDSTHVKNDKYSLYFEGKDENFNRHAYYRISGDLLKAGELDVTLPVIKQKDFSVSSNGEFGMKVELFYKKKGRYKDDIYDTPDSLFYLNIPEGINSYQNITGKFILPDNVACIFLSVGGTHFSGECWLEAPRLIQGKKLICSIPFTKFVDKSDDFNYWVGCNLSTRSWPC